MMLPKKIFYIIILSLINFTQISLTKNIYILVHGTWGTKNDWHQKSSPFFCNLAQSIHEDDKIVVFNWPAKLSHISRINGGNNLAQLIDTFPEDTQINIIAHSHGANVAIIASQILAKNKNNRNRIKRVFALAGPVDTKLYSPNMDVIKYYYNFFSFNDLIQPVFGFYERIFPSHERIANIKVELNGKQPAHREIVAPCIAKWLPHIHENRFQKMDETFKKFNFLLPCTIEFYENQPPIYLQENWRDSELVADREINKHKIYVDNFRN